MLQDLDSEHAELSAVSFRQNSYSSLMQGLPPVSHQFSDVVHRAAVAPLSAARDLFPRVDPREFRQKRWVECLIMRTRDAFNMVSLQDAH